MYKPMTHTVWEARQMTKLAHKNSICTQMGNQGTATDGIREGAEFVRTGGLGEVKEIHAWTNRPAWPQAPQIIARPKEKMDVPDHIDWDSFIGPAPMRPYHSCYTPFKWRGWWDYGTGALGDMACHTTNLAFMACELTQPTSVESVNTGPINDETFPSWATIHMNFPKTENEVLLSFIGMKVRLEMMAKQIRESKIFLQWTYFTSSSRKIVVYYWLEQKVHYILLTTMELIGWYTSRENGIKEMKSNYQKKFLPRIGRGDAGMKEELVKAIRENNPKIAMSNFDYAGNMTECILLGNVAMRAGGNLNGMLKNSPLNRDDANKLISKVYRNQWGFEQV